MTKHIPGQMNEIDLSTLLRKLPSVTTQPKVCFRPLGDSELPSRKPRPVSRHTWQPVPNSCCFQWRSFAVQAAETETTHARVATLVADVQLKDPHPGNKPWWTNVKLRICAEHVIHCSGSFNPSKFDSKLATHGKFTNHHALHPKPTSCVSV